MIKDIKYFIAQTKANFGNAHALAGSFWIGVFSMILNNLAFFIIWILFMRSTGVINGWTSMDVFGMLGVAMLCFGVCHSFFYGLVELPEIVMQGTFDNVLLSPINSFLKLSSSYFSITAYGDLFMGLFVVIFYGIYMKFSFYIWIIFILAILSGCTIFICIRFLYSLVTFFIYDGEIISQQLFEVFLRPGLYPGGIFPNKMKIFFMTVVPALLTSALPIDIIKNSSISILLFSFLVTTFWIFVTIFVYKIAVKRYESGNLLR
ncbi:MAG: ABC-2 family transporter protein [Candidatus Nomurabacteria bacterium]|nr:ABC-2 family transporter protein [Candidatus Nomurabacteria bacterium]